MIASLPMYDRPETAAVNDRLWQLIREYLPFDAPDALTRNIPDLMAHWQSPDLLLSQTCGFPYRALLAGRVKLVATPVLALDCPAGHYHSVIIAHRRRNGAALAEFDGAVAAYNDPMSQSGWAALHGHFTDAGLSLGQLLETGAHRASAKAVAEGRADIAAIDALTWQMIRRWDTFAEELCEIARTTPTPALPYICAPRFDAAAIAHALSQAITMLAPEDRTRLGLVAVTQLGRDAYLAVPTPPPPAS
ncbi:phosphate/phosphite/phosphonate ABC transporter substrate-binding protein [Litoreibacter arenae]|uniref:ABC-type phosphate/phosphonate transport system, periplasmic component n=1 Tax=Litoreibacter arenae DSM 19593 TaxID=1123360 RepID=S9QKC2_9RHOB|nr:PhnD/SsuA/transferrin family substrate-binding protein [Litoreibacter arenae]EPX80028.1 ABC-type phosphate/phosphonate transport system, periplasmic component [Litoreibacter arenae DSM 19593]